MVQQINGDLMPLYKIVKRELRCMIDGGAYAPGTRIPTETELMLMHGVSRITVRSAVKELAEEGLLVKLQGKGTFVAEAQPKRSFTIDVSSFSEFCSQNGMNASRHALFARIEPAPDLPEAIRVCGQGDVIHLARLLSVDSVPLIIAEDYMPMDFGYVLNGDLDRESLNEVICRGSGGLVRGIRSVERTLEICTADASDAALLKVNAGTPLFLVSDIAADQSGRLIRHTRERIVGDSVKVLYRPDAAFTIERTANALRS